MLSPALYAAILDPKKEIAAPPSPAVKTALVDGHGVAAGSLQTKTRTRTPRKAPGQLFYWKLGLENYSLRQGRREETIAAQRKWSEHADFAKLQGDGPVEMPFEVYTSMLSLLFTEAIPIDRVRVWQQYGEITDRCERILGSLGCFGINGTRAAQIFQGLISIQPYPSKKRLESCEVSEVLFEFGNLRYG